MDAELLLEPVLVTVVLLLGAGGLQLAFAPAMVQLVLLERAEVLL